ncbi:hypothetical protein G6F56_004980 [Rhizopus delemar]|nr:hypothetical protein G6F56_004980 [Rhizopus delemar]
MQPPAVQQPRGRPRGAGNRVASRNISSTQRDPSSFEYVEGRSSATRRCGVCSGTGHNRRRCPLVNGEDSSPGFQIPSQEGIPIEVNLRDSDSEDNWVIPLKKVVFIF